MSVNLKSWRFATENVLQVSVMVPDENAQSVMDAVLEVTDLKYGDYDKVMFKSAAGVQSFRSLGTGRNKATGKIVNVPCCEVVFTIPANEDLSARVLEAVFDKHPYEEPVIHITQTTRTLHHRGLDEDNPHRFWNSVVNWLPPEQLGDSPATAQARSQTIAERASEPVVTQVAQPAIQSSSQEQSGANPVNDIKLYMFNTGSLKLKVHNIKMNQGDGADYEIPVPFFLLTHPRGHTLIDGGVAVECAKDAMGYWGGVSEFFQPQMKESEGCVEQLKSIGIKPEDIKFVVQSHLHLDHTGSLGRFPNATYIVQRSEYEYARNPDWYAAPAYIPREVDLPLNWQFLEGTQDDFYDVYGDGVLQTVFSPGHAPGHMSLMVNLPNTRNILLAIDAAYTTDHWEEQALPGFVSSAVDAVRSVKKLRALAEKTDALVVTGHDPDDWKRFKKAPDFYS